MSEERSNAAEGVAGVTLDVERLRAENEQLRGFLALRSSGHTGPMTERIPWFIHCGISHGENRPDCLVCAALSPTPEAAPDVCPMCGSISVPAQQRRMYDPETGEMRPGPWMNR